VETCSFVGRVTRHIAGISSGKIVETFKKAGQPDGADFRETAEDGAAEAAPSVLNRTPESH
jgi:hypothetical protein